MTAEASKQGRAPRDQVFWARLGLVTSMFFAVGFSLTCLFTNPKVVLLRWPGPPARAQQIVRSTATELARAWHPEDRARVIERLQAAEDQDELRQALGEALRTSDPKLKKALVDCAGALNAHEIRNDIVAIATEGVGPSQIAAIGVAHKMRRWRGDEAAELMANGDRSVRFAVLDAIGKEGGELPDSVLLQCLISDDAQERDLARRAVPRELTKELRRDLAHLASHGPPSHAARALCALAQCADAVTHVELAFSCLHGRPNEVRRAALEFLSTVDAPLPRTEQIWSVVIDASGDEKLRVFALYCLERLGSVDQEALAMQVVMMSPPERLAAARCFVRAGNEQAVDILVGLVTRDDEASVVESSRRLLAWLTGAPVGTTPAEFRAAFDRSGRRMRTRYLPELGLALD